MARCRQPGLIRNADIGQSRVTDAVQLDLALTGEHDVVLGGDPVVVGHRVLHLEQMHAGLALALGDETPAGGPTRTAAGGKVVKLKYREAIGHGRASLRERAFSAVR